MSSLKYASNLEGLFAIPVVYHLGGPPSPACQGRFAVVKLVINHLATTRNAQPLAIPSGFDFPEPGVDANQLDCFLDIAFHIKALQELNPNEVSCSRYLGEPQTDSYQQAIIEIAIKISEYLGILFNWDENAVCFQDNDLYHYGAEVKTIVLETVYAIAHRVQSLLKALSNEVDAALMNRCDPRMDPATISCALWMIYSSVNKWQKLSSNAKSLKSLVRRTHHTCTHANT